MPIGLLILLISCTTSSSETLNLNRVAYQASKKIENEFPMICEGIGASIPQKIKSCDLTFIYFSPLTIDEGRNLILICLQRTFEAFKQDTSIQKHLEEPFEPKNIEIYLFSNQYDFNEPPPGILSALSLVHGNIKYKRYNSQTNKLETILEESYEEALTKCLH
jgi:hypothetical protein